MRLLISCLAVMLIGGVTLFAQSAENLALRPDAVPIARVTAPTGGQPEDINIINNEVVTEESYDSYDGANVAGEDWYGYTWSEPLYFDTLIFYEGTPSAAGGYWKSLTVQYTMDGANWLEAGHVAITPEYDYSDDPAREPYSRYELTFTGCLGNGVRLYGQPGGPSYFTSIAELEVFGTKPEVVCTRALPASYEPGQNVNVSLTLDVDAENAPTSLAIVELIPEGLTVTDPGTGDTSQPGEISWSFSEGEVESQTLNYSVAAPGGQSGILHFSGTLTYPGTASQDITGAQTVAPAPPAPSGLQVLFDVDAHLSWSPIAQEGIAGYKVYRSEEGGDFTDISGLILDNDYTDYFVENAKTYRYKVISQNTTGAVSDLAESQPSSADGPSLLRRQFEDYDYEGGSYPGGVGKNGSRAAFRSDLDFTDFFYQEPNQTNTYRPQDLLAIPAFNAEERYIGATAPSDWWRFTFDLPEEGFVKIGAIRAATDGDAIIEFFWDTSHQGWFSFNSGGLSNWQTMPVDTPAFYSLPGRHSLRIILSVGNADFDYFGIGFEQPEPSRVTRLSEDFESSPAGWTIFNGSGEPDAAWQSWSVTGDPLVYEDPDLPGMKGKYFITDADLAGSTELDLDEQLISPEIDCTGYVGVMVQFGSNIKVDEYDFEKEQFYDLHVRTYDEDTQSWSDWANVFHHERDDGDDSSPQFVDISSLADDKKIKLRWHFWKANYDYWWAIDNIRVTAEEPSAGEGRILSVEIAGDTISLTWESFGTGFYRVQHREDLMSGDWADVPGHPWPITETHWSGAVLPGNKSGFYRVTSDEELPEGRILSVEIAADTISLTWEPFGTGSYRVQHREDLMSGTWADVPGYPWPIEETDWAGAVLPADKSGFYRVVSP